MSHARVLVVDSDRRFRSQISTRLLDCDVFSDAVANGTEAREILQDQHYGLILLDLELANDEADRVIDTVRMLRASERPMILATASRHARSDVDADLVQIVIRKPVRLADLADMIRSCLGSAVDAMARREQRRDGAIEIAAADEEIVGIVR